MVRFNAPDSSLTLSAGELSPGATFANRPARVSSGRSMNILLLGSGGREDALAWRLRQSPSCAELLAAPGNPGIARWASCMPIDPCDPSAVVSLAQDRDIDLVVVGPEAPLAAGVADALRSAGIATFCPSAAAAQAMAELNLFGIPVVIKSGGLAGGKGVPVALDRDEARAALESAEGAV